MPWKKGQSGNPGGRTPLVLGSKELDLGKLARRFTRESLATVLSIMRGRDNPPAVRLAAAEVVMKRGHGNPISTNVHQNPDGSAIDFNEMSTEQLMAGVRRVEAALGQDKHS